MVHEPAPSCRHRLYRFTCEEFDRLQERSGGHCEICRKPGGDYGRPLVIDHDHDVGRWAVRGLICQGCNSYELPYREPTPSVLAYLDHPWYRTLMAGAGVSIEGPPEPGIGGVVNDRIGRSQWNRTWDGWVTHHRSPTPWRDLVKKFGPYNLVIVDVGRSQDDPVVAPKLHVNDPASVAHELRKYMPPGVRQALGRLLLEE